MNPDIVQYVGFIVAALILTWGVIELNRRYFDRRKVDNRPLNSSWVNMDIHRAADADETEVSLPGGDTDEEEEDDEKAQSGIQSRAKQNGHHSPKQP
jgi:hypothetical protein